MAATLQHCAAATATTLPTAATAAPANPKLKRIVYSKYRELLGSYNDKANAIIETLPAYMVHEDRGFNFETTDNNENLNFLKISDTGDIYGSANGQRQQSSNYEAPACVQNAMMTKDKKPFTYTPGGIDLSQIKSERMAKRLQRNALADGTTGAQQQQRPAQPQSPGGSAAAAMGAAALGMPFQVLPPPPPPPQPGMAGKQATSNGSTPAPPPPPPTNTFSNNTKMLAPPANAGGPGSAPGSPNAQRKSPTPQRFEPPPLGFRPEIKIPTNPMANLRKVPPPVEKNTFWKDEYVKERSKSPMVGENDRSTSPAAGPPQNNNYNYNNSNNVNDDIAFKQPTPSSAQDAYSNNQHSGALGRMQPMQQQYNTAISPAAPATPPQATQQNSPRTEFRSVAAPQSPAVNVYTRQGDSPRTVVDGMSTDSEQRANESPFKFAQQQQQPPQQSYMQRPPAAMSPLAQQPAQQQLQQTPSPLAATNNVQPPQSQSQTQSQLQSSVPWRTQRSQNQQQQQRQQSPQPIYNNVQPTAQQQPQAIYNNVQQRARSPGPNAYTAQQQQQQQQQQQSYDKPTSVGSLYIAPLAQPSEPQAPHIVRQQLQQQQQQRNSPMRQLGTQPVAPQQLRWLSSQPAPKEQPAWARQEENGNVMPSSLQRLKSPPPPSMQQQQQPAAQQQYYQQPAQQQPTQQQQQVFPPQQQVFPPQQQVFPPQQGNGYANTFSGQPSTGGTGLRLHINNNTNSASGPKERIIPIQLEQTPTSSPSQPNFGSPNYAPSNTNVAGYIIRSPNQFVDQGYNNFAQQQQQQGRAASAQRVMSPTQQLNSPHIMQQQQQNLQATNNVSGGHKTRIIPIAFEGGNSGGAASSSPIIFQNDSRTPPIQSKSFRILQKITDTVDDGSSDEQITKNNIKNINNAINDKETAQLQRPQYARQMSAQEAKNSPPIEQMRRMQMGQEQGNNTPQQNRFIQRPSYEQQQQYVPPSEQHVPEPKKYTGSAIPSRSFKLLQAMTTPENAGPGQSDL